MPWKRTNVVDQRVEFVSRRLGGERMTDLCREYGISRKTGHKIFNRYKDLGPPGLLDQPRAPGVVRHATAPEIVDLILAAKREKPTWGAKKLLVLLERRHAGLGLPCRSTVHDILSRHDLVKRHKRRRRACPTPRHELTEPNRSNRVRGGDYKGQFRMLDRTYCYPLTISDLFSRFVIGCEAFAAIKLLDAQRCFGQAFERYGLPEVIRTDNGAPFASTGLLGLSRLSVWWMRLGICHERIEPGCPQQNGVHERMHRTLKLSATRPPGQGLLQQQEKLDAFCREFNEERPHEGIEMKCPADVYKPSDRPLPSIPPEPTYPLHDDFRRIDSSGMMRLWGTSSCYVSVALAGQTVGLRQLTDDRWLVSFMALDLGHVHSRQGRFQAMATTRK